MRTADPHAPTKEKLLDAAQKLVMSKGYAGTSIGDICREAKSSKGSFFHFFKNKEDLAKILLARYTDGQVEMMRSAPSARSKDPRKRALGFVDAVIATFNDQSLPKSCVTGQIAQEMSATNPAMRSACAECFGRVCATVATELRAGGVSKSDELAEMLISIMQGSFIMAKAQGDIAVGVRNLKHFRRYLEGLTV
ncbi:MAG: TetR/AcrR family transcriptional regulator [Elusimicrobiota bacterium]